MMDLIKRLIILVLCVSMLGLWACDMETNPQALMIIGNTKPEDDGTVKASGGLAEFIPAGILDLSLGTRYRVYLTVQNNFPVSDEGGESLPGLIEPGNVTIDALRVGININTALIAQDANVLGAIPGLGLPGTLEGLLSYDVPCVAALPAGLGGIAACDLIIHNIGQLFRHMGTLAAGGDVMTQIEMQVIGRRADNEIVKSGIFRYPLRFCNNCLVVPDELTSVAVNPQPENKEPSQMPILLGADEYVSNVICGFLWGPEGAGDTCSLDRCMGRVVSTAAGGTPPLVCPSDGVEISPPVVIE